MRIAAAAAVSALALVPFLVPDAGLRGPLDGAESAVHTGAFAVGTLVWVLAVPRAWPWVALGALALAAGSEGLQGCCIDGRGGTLPDLAADAAGVALGLAAAGAIHVARRGGPRRR